VKKQSWFTWAAIFLVAAPQFVRAQSASIRSSAQYASGDYIFAERTQSVYVSVGGSVYTTRFSIGVDVPFVYQSSPYITYGLITPVPTGGPQHGSVDRQRGAGRRGSDGSGSAVPTTTPLFIVGNPVGGIADRSAQLNSGRPDPVLVPDDTVAYNQFGLSDPVFSVSATLISANSSHPSILVNGTVKTPTGSVDNGFSTGAWDYSAGLSTLYAMHHLFVAASVTYFINGDMESLTLDNSIGLSATLGRNWKAGQYGLFASGFYSTPIIDGVEAPVSASLGVAYSRFRKVSLTLVASIGLSESTPGYSLSFGIQRPL
jgi:hypothetical protein